jgi:hypothetical protein
VCLTRAFLCVPVAFSNVISEHFKHWKSPEFPKRPTLLTCLPLQSSQRTHPHPNQSQHFSLARSTAAKSGDG